MKRYYCICQKRICIESPFFSDKNPDWKLFEIQPSEADINISCQVVGEMPSPLGKETQTVSGTFVSSDGNKVCRRVDMAVNPGVEVFYDSVHGKTAQAYFTRESLPIMMDERYMWNSIATAQLLLPEGALFMHASYIEHDNKAILFSGQCGVGKSTQAALWQKHRSAKIINGDKAGILVTEDAVYAQGLPFCGTSGICNNVTLPLGAIVLLEQGERNEAGRISGTQALLGVIENIYLDFLAPYEQQMCIDLLIKLLGAVPVYRLTCTPDEAAVKALENAFRKGAV